MKFRENKRKNLENLSNFEKLARLENLRQSKKMEKFEHFDKLEQLDGKREKHSKSVLQSPKLSKKEKLQRRIYKQKYERSHQKIDGMRLIQQVACEAIQNHKISNYL